jgi:hypothetical protein
MKAKQCCSLANKSLVKIEEKREGRKSTVNTGLALVKRNSILGNGTKFLELSVKLNFSGISREIANEDGADIDVVSLRVLPSSGIGSSRSRRVHVGHGSHLVFLMTTITLK